MKLNKTKERINALRVLHNLTVEELAIEINVPVFRMKVLCGQRLTFIEWLKFKFYKGGGHSEWRNGKLFKDTQIMKLVQWVWCGTPELADV